MSGCRGVGLGQENPKPFILLRAVDKGFTQMMI